MKTKIKKYLMVVVMAVGMLFSASMSAFVVVVVVKQNCYTWDGLISACALLRTESALHCMNVV